MTVGGISNSSGFCFLFFTLLNLLFVDTIVRRLFDNKRGVMLTLVVVYLTVSVINMGQGRTLCEA